MSTTPSAIGAGGFGAVFALPAHPKIATKIVKVRNEEHESALENEYRMITKLYGRYFSHPTTSNFTFQIPTPLDLYTRDSQSAHRKTQQSKESIIFQTSEIFARLNESSIPYAGNAAYAMARIPDLPHNFANTLLDQLPASTAARYKGQPIAMCRLYFGKPSIARTSFLNLRNYPIELASYAELTKSDPLLPHPRMIVREMGRILGAILTAGFDGRDIEFVLAGSMTIPGGWDFHVFDFNQLRSLSDDSETDAHTLADAYKLNDPYFPRPGNKAQFWDDFKAGYLAETGAGSLKTAERFFEILEQERRL